MRELDSSFGRKIDNLRELRERSFLGGGKERIDQQHSKGKLTARERLDLLLEPSSFVETDRFALSQSRNLGSEEKRILGDGVVTGHGTIDARLVCVFAHDFTVLGCSLGDTFAMKMQNEITSPLPGRVKKVLVKEGETVKKDSIMIVLE